MAFIAALLDGLQSIFLKSYSTLAVLPIIPFLLAFTIARFRNRSAKQSYLFAMDVTVPFLAGCNAGLINQLFNSWFGVYVMLFILLVWTGLLGKLHMDKYGQLHYKKLSFAIWRLYFMVLALLYILLMSAGLLKYFVVGVF